MKAQNRKTRRNAPSDKKTGASAVTTLPEACEGRNTVARALRRAFPSGDGEKPIPCDPKELHELLRPRFFRLISPLSGVYCNLAAGEIVRLTPEGTLTTWMVERRGWLGPHRLLNVLTRVPDHALVVESLDPKNESLT